jgi:hypothetical protein
LLEKTGLLSQVNIQVTEANSRDKPPKELLPEEFRPRREGPKLWCLGHLADILVVVVLLHTVVQDVVVIQMSAVPAASFLGDGSLPLGLCVMPTGHGGGCTLPMKPIVSPVKVSSPRPRNILSSLDNLVRNI